MRYLKIQNKGTLPLKLLTLIGASTKTNDLSKIGEFGTGLKYAIAYFIRHKINVKLFIGVHEIPITVRENKIGSDIYCEIVINKKPSGITTQYGFQWKAWEALREIWCNALDEKGAISVPVEDVPLIGTKGHTTFYIERTTEINEVLNKWSDYFIDPLKEIPLYSDENFAIYHNQGRKLKLYKNGVLTHTSEWYNSIFRYDIKKSHLNELREYKGFMHGDIATALLRSNNTVGNILLKHFKPSEDINQEKKRKELFEVGLDYSYSIEPAKDRFKQIFEGYVFLHPDSSSRAISDKAVKVSESLFKIVKTWVPTEQIHYSSGGGYYGGGGGGGYVKDDSPYKPITNPQLKARLDKLFAKHQMSNVTYEIAVPMKESFDFLIDNKNSRSYTINTDVEKLNDKDLEVLVLLILIEHRGDTPYKVIKRLLKANLSNRNLKKIIFEQ